YSYINCGFLRSAPKSAISARPLRKAKPTGCCMKEFAVKIHNAEVIVPKTIIHPKNKCNFFPTLSQVNIHKPIKVDSIKNDNNASKASGAPNMYPMNLYEYDKSILKQNT